MLVTPTSVTIILYGDAVSVAVAAVAALIALDSPRGFRDPHQKEHRGERAEAVMPPAKYISATRGTTLGEGLGRQ